MFRKMLPWLIMILIVITLIAVAAFVLWNYMDDSFNSDNPSSQAKQGEKTVQVKKLTAEQLLKVSSVLDNVTTNLADKDFIVKISFAFQLDNKDTKSEFDKILNLRIKPIIVKTLADTKPDELSGTKGFDMISSKLINSINPVLPEGKVLQVEVTDFILQPIN